MSLLLLSSQGGGPTPPVGQLLPALSASDLCLLPTRFGGGVWAETQQLGRIPSWGPEIGMLTSKADRQAVYAAHRAKGAKGIYFCVYGHYQESGVAYPEGIALWNDFTGNNFAQVIQLALEIASTVESGGGGLYVFLHLGGDELGSAWVTQNAAAIAAALKAAGLEGRVLVVPTFDSNSDGDWSDPGDNWASCNLAMAAAFGPNIPIGNWLPTGWARLGYNASTPVTEGEAVVGRWCTEGCTTIPCLFNGDWPQVNTAAGSTWDEEHQQYQPVAWTSDVTAWYVPVQVLGRRVQPGKWNAPPGTPYDVPGGLGIGGPQAGQPVTISVDSRNPPSYTSAGQSCSNEEPFTFSWTHQDGITEAQIDNVRAGSLTMGCDTTG